jgi:acetylornithine deacetylase/succinyl-diaminopimelate desuccinylase-like protein
VPSAVPVINRRSVLAGGAALAVLGAGVFACSKPRPKPPPVEELLAPLDEARRDSAVASAAAAAVGLAPQVAAALTVVATQRAAHARALSTEISRVSNKLTPPTSETTSSSASPTGAAAPPPPPPAVSDVIDTLRASAESANRLVATSSGYQAGLLASIAASCTASCTVALVPGGPSI